MHARYAAHASARSYAMLLSMCEPRLINNNDSNIHDNYMRVWPRSTAPNETPIGVRAAKQTTKRSSQTSQHKKRGAAVLLSCLLCCCAWSEHCRTTLKQRERGRVREGEREREKERAEVVVVVIVVDVFLGVRVALIPSPFATRNIIALRFGVG